MAVTLELPLQTMSDPNKPAALIVDDDERFRERLCQAFAKRGWEVFGAADGVAALARRRAETDNATTG